MHATSERGAGLGSVGGSCLHTLAFTDAVPTASAVYTLLLLGLDHKAKSAKTEAKSAKLIARCILMESQDI
jgi:hypothetical protein